MARPATYPTLYDECKTVSITFLKANGYLEHGHYKAGSITWSRGEGQGKQITGSISITVSMQAAIPYAQLDYTTNGQAVSYKVPLAATLPTLVKGLFGILFVRPPASGAETLFDWWPVPAPCRLYRLLLRKTNPIA